MVRALSKIKLNLPRRSGTALVRLRSGWEWQEAQSISGLTKRSFFLYQEKVQQGKHHLHLHHCSTTCDLNFMGQEGGTHIPERHKRQRGTHIVPWGRFWRGPHDTTYLPLTKISSHGSKVATCPSYGVGAQWLSKDVVMDPGGQPAGWLLLDTPKWLLPHTLGRSHFGLGMQEQPHQLLEAGICSESLGPYAVLVVGCSENYPCLWKHCFKLPQQTRFLL